MAIEAKILERTIKGLNSLENPNWYYVNIIINKEDANELKTYLSNYNANIKKSIITKQYMLQVSKKEKVV